MYEIEAHEPYSILPAQFFHDPPRPWTAEQRLMLEILKGAITELTIHPGRYLYRNTRLAREAEEWVQAEDFSWLYSFVTICQHLGLDAERLRAHLMTQQKGAQHADSNGQEDDPVFYPAAA